jgi:hypothetical protein
VLTYPAYAQRSCSPRLALDSLATVLRWLLILSPARSHLEMRYDEAADAFAEALRIP